MQTFMWHRDQKVVLCSHIVPCNILTPSERGRNERKSSYRQILKLRKSISPHVLFAELAEAPWQRTWWSQGLHFMHRLDSMDEGSLHPDILSDNIHDALGNPGCCSWAAGVQKQFASLGVPSPCSGGRIRNVDHLAFCKAMLARDMSV